VCSSDAGKTTGRVAPFYLLTAICQGLTLLFLNSQMCKDNSLLSEGTSVVWPESCSLGTGANCIISATVFWFAAAASSFLEQKAIEEALSAPDPELAAALNPA